MKILWNPTQLTCNLTIGDWPACKGIQKITGFARGLSFHRVDYFPYWHISNSIVLGYNRASKTSAVKLWMYCYVNGIHIQKEMGLHEAGTKLTTELSWKYADVSIYENGKLKEYETILGNGIGIPNKTLPIGYLLNSYAEIDGTEIRMQFNPDVRDVVVR